MTNSVFIESDQGSVTDARPRTLFVGTCPDCTIPARLKIEDEKRDHCWGSCPDCDNGLKIKYERIYALVTMGQCDGRCMGATGQICNCACGGDNHAGAWTKDVFKTDVRASYIKKLLAERKKTVERRIEREAVRREKAAEPFNEWKRSLWGDDAELVEWLSVYENVEFNAFLVDMRLRMMPRPGKEAKYPARPLTEKQFAACHKIRNSQRAFEERKRIEALSAKPAPSGRVELAGEIVSQKVVDNDYGAAYKMLVKCNGFKVWGSCPRDLVQQVFAADGYKKDGTSTGYVRGLKIKFHATVEPKEDDPSFGIFKRPTRAELISEVPVITYEVPEIMNREHDDRTDLQKTIAKNKPKTSENVPETPAVESAPNVQSNAPAPVAKRSGSHADCQHEATKSARAKCRKERGSK